MKISIDAMGGDRAPEVVIEGAAAALEECPEIKTLFLVGDQQKLLPLVKKYQLPTDRYELVHTDEMVEMHESGAKMLRKKKKASISIATDLVKSGEADAVVGAGNTGAAVANATVKLRTLEGVSKASIGSILPNSYGKCLLTDAGANPSPRPENFVESAFMGAVYMKRVWGVERPRIGIMSNGEEEEKGTDLTKGAHAIMKEIIGRSTDLPFEYLGYIEGRDVFLSDVQVCLTDGFTGNVMLKTAEGIAKAMSQWIKDEYKSSPLNLPGALLSKSVFESLRDRTSYEKVGGSLLLGVNGICVIGHGSSNALAIQNAIKLAASSVVNRINEDIVDSLKKHCE